MVHDPLKSLEKKQKQTLHIRKIWYYFRFFVSYIFVTGIVFFVLLWAMNYEAYFARILNAIDPSSLQSARAEIEHILASTNIEVHASESDTQERIDNLESVTEKIRSTDPEMIYKKRYEADELIANIKDGMQASTFSITPYENRIIIPKIWKNIPLIDVTLDVHPDYEVMHETFMEELKKWVVRYPGTAMPWEVGNAFIFWHSSNYPWIKSEYNDVFALLDTLENGDEIIVYYHQKKFIYRVTDRATVRPGDVHVLEKRDKTKKELSLMTCWPVWSTLERLIIFAELTESVL